MINNMENKKFFLYARKSTDVEDKQVLSIDAQLTELREYAVRENIEISAEIIEKQSAKVPGRPLFNKMMLEIETFGGNILAWNPDRLARNSVDGGKVIYLLDTGKLASIKFPTFWCDNTGQGKFMLNMAFGQSKYYVDSLSENTKRGLRQKVRMGIFPSQAPVGYLNDSRTKTIVVEKKKSRIVRLAFEKYTKGNMRLLFWRSPALPPEQERESLKPKRLLSSQILFISDYSNMVVKSTKESTSQSFQRNFLMKHR